MSFAMTRARAVAAPQFEDSTGCPARGCPCKGSADAGGGFICSFHGAAKSEDWPKVTEGLIQHVWLRDFITDLMRNDKLATERAWREWSSEFWKDSDVYMVPGASESRSHYLYRLHLELMHRVGARPARPAPFTPQRKSFDTPRGNLSALLGEVRV